MTPIKYLICASLLVSACAQTPKATLKADVQEPEAAQTAPAMQLPNVELSSELLYGFLLSEIAAQRGEDAIAVEGSSSLAQKTRDPRLAMRAAHMAIQTGRIDKAIESIRIWQEADPNSPMATRMLASALLRTGRIEEARDELVKVLDGDKEHVEQNLIQTYQMLASYPDKAAALSIMRDIAASYPEKAESHWAVAQMSRYAGEDELALSEVRSARNIRPEWDMAASLEAQILQKKAPQESLEILRAYIKKYPDASELRLQYARLLLEQKQFESSRDQFQILSDDNPENPDMAYAIALISLQMNDLPRAEKQLQLSLEKGKSDQDTVQYYLGQLAEAKKNDEEALAHYRQVAAGENLFSAQIRVVYLLSKTGRRDEADQYLNDIQPANDDQRIKLVLVEANILRMANRYPEAYQMLKKNLEVYPENPELLYETAMMAEKNDEFENFESLMRKLIDLDPGRAHAYNALGYSLMERNVRLPEAMELVRKAVQLAPDDAAIIDSLGWGYFLTGNQDESLKQLRHAFSMNPDPEIAAHLGEVLWVSGQKDEAKKIWQDSKKDNPDNAVLETVIKRFLP